MEAIYSYDEETVSLVLAAGVDVDAVDNVKIFQLLNSVFYFVLFHLHQNGDTALRRLFHSISLCCLPVDIIVILIKAGAEVKF